MRKLGLIGGTSWHSTIEYYREINQLVNDHFGDNTNPPLMVYTLNQSEIHDLQRKNEWNEIAQRLTEAALSLKNAGAQAAMFCANTPHKVFHSVNDIINLPLLHIADATAHAIKKQEISKVGLIGTKFTMTEDFLIKRLSENGVEAIVPKEATVVEELHRIIQEELTFGRIEARSKEYVINCIKEMTSKGAEGIILGCTEFPLMLSQNDLSIPLFNTTRIHAQAAVDFILSQ